MGHLLCQRSYLLSQWPAQPEMKSPNGGLIRSSIVRMRSAARLTPQPFAAALAGYYLQPKGKKRNAMTMESRFLGSTGLMVSRLGLGLAALGRPGYINLDHAKDLGAESSEAAMEHRARGVLDTAWSAGIRYFDAARSYGLGEKFLAGWLRSRSISRSAVTVGSKWGYIYTADWKIQAQSNEIKDHTLSNLQKQWRESACWLNGYIGLYQIHSATMESGVLDDPTVLEELVRLKIKGIHIGLSLSGPDQTVTLRKAMAIVLAGSRLFETVQATWNLLEPSAGPALAQAHAAGMGVIVKEALANGRLTNRNPDPAFAPKLAVLQQEAARFDGSLDTIALAACLAQPFADVVLSGAVTPEQVLSNAKSLRLTLDSEAISRLTALAEPAESYWATRKNLPWN
jgi:aryl-alcohol dehydrogenase-like predicted oxidoreductase